MILIGKQDRPRVDSRRIKKIDIRMDNNTLTGKLPAFGGLASGAHRSSRRPSRALGSVDLSKNKLTSSIPEKLGDFKLIMLLDFCWNELSRAYRPPRPNYIHLFFFEFIFVTFTCLLHIFRFRNLFLGM